jgi:hypothetical protein
MFVVFSQGNIEMSSNCRARLIVRVEYVTILLELKRHESFCYMRPRSKAEDVDYKACGVTEEALACLAQDGLDFEFRALTVFASAMVFAVSMRYTHLDFRGLFLEALLLFWCEVPGLLGGWISSKMDLSSMVARRVETLERKWSDGCG